MTTRRFVTTTFVLAVTVGSLVMPRAASANPTFNSTSTGSDGALDFSGLASGTTLEFDPTQLTNPSTGSPLDPAGDNVYNFTTIYIPNGVTIRMHANHNRNAPVYWLASGNVDIEGTLDLSGDPGHPQTLDTTWGPSQPGPGGYPGGVGTTTSNIIPNATAGLGPGGITAGGEGAGWDCCGFSPWVCSAEFAQGTHAYGNLFLLPLIGGSGGSGGVGGGGAGGGAILIASSTGITVGGTIRANGGIWGSSYAGEGSGGAIRLMAPTITGGGNITAQGSYGLGCDFGYVRMEAFQNTYTGGIQGVSRQVTLSPTAVLGLPTAPAAALPVVNVVTVGGVSVPAAPTASFLNPDVTINSSAPLTIGVSAANLPTTATVSVYIFNETLGVQSATVTLSGTTTSSSGTATVTLPPGFSHVYASATWSN